MKTACTLTVDSDIDQCDSGTFQTDTLPGTLMSVCTPCANGKYQPSKGQSMCLDHTVCGLGQEPSNTPTSTTDRECNLCIQNTWSDGNNNKCKNCSMVKKGYETVTVCNASMDTVTALCDTDSYQNNEAMGTIKTTCTPFPPPVERVNVIENTFTFNGMSVEQAQNKSEDIRRALAKTLQVNLKDIVLTILSGRRRRRVLSDSVVIKVEVYTNNATATDNIKNSLQEAPFVEDLNEALMALDVISEPLTIVVSEPTVMEVKQVNVKTVESTWRISDVFIYPIAIGVTIAIICCFIGSKHEDTSVRKQNVYSPNLQKFKPMKIGTHNNKLNF